MLNITRGSVILFRPLPYHAASLPQPANLAPGITNLSPTAPILPGATLGMLGGGQLGRMFTLAARRMGYRVHVLTPEAQSPAGQVADREVLADYEDLEAVRRFASGVRVVSYEFENVPAACARAASEAAPLRPGPAALEASQDRLTEKRRLAEAGLPVTPFAAVENAADLERAIETVGLPAVLKTRRFGYDGKGQAPIRTAEEANPARAAIDHRPAILERFVPFTAELSVVGARGLDGAFVHYGPMRNEHVDHVLDLSVCPGGFSDRIAREAVELARAVLEKFEVVGVLCVEMFLGENGLIVNELAPRPHNSGHLTIDAHATCQFEQQLRAVCGLPLGATTRPRPAAMVNLLGACWAGGEPDWAAALAVPETHLHLYGKAEPRTQRKMGHLTALADTPEEAIARARAARAQLAPAAR